MAKKTIAQHIKTALAEGKFADKFNSEVYLRLNLLNSTHLYYMEEHLEQVNRGARSSLWREANTEMLEKVSREIKWRTKIIDAEIREEELEEERRRKKEEMESLRKAEEQRVMRSIVDNARSRAAEEVREEEKRRLAQERVRVVALVKEAYRRRDRLLVGALGLLVVGLVLIAALVQNPIYLSVGIVGVLTVTAGVLYRAYSITRIFPITKSKKDLEIETERRAEQLIEEALEGLRLKEEEYQERLRLERRERKEWRKQRKELERQEMERIAQRKIERQQLVASMLQKRISDGASAMDLIIAAKTNSAILKDTTTAPTGALLKLEKSQRKLAMEDSYLDEMRKEQMAINRRKSDELTMPH